MFFFFWLVLGDDSFCSAAEADAGGSGGCGLDDTAACDMVWDCIDGFSGSVIARNFDGGMSFNLLGLTL